MLSIQNEREWRRFCEGVLQQPDLAVDPRFDTGSRRVAHREALHAEIDKVFVDLDGDALAARLADARIAHARRRELAEVLEHPQLAARDRWRTLDSPAGRISALVPPIGYDGREPRMDPIPDVGADTERILRWLADG